MKLRRNEMELDGMQNRAEHSGMDTSKEHPCIGRVSQIYVWEVGRHA